MQYNEMIIIQELTQVCILYVTFIRSIVTYIIRNMNFNKMCL